VDLTAIVLAHEHPFAIGDVEIRPATREIAGPTGVAIVEPRVMQLLVALHRAEGGVVSKDDLAKLCWEGRIVGEDAINRVVSRLRSVAENQAGGAFRVETITKVGYRLTSPSGMQRSPPEAAKAGDPKVSRRSLLIGGSILTAAAAAGAVWTFERRERIPPEALQLLNDSRSSVLQGTLDQLSSASGKLKQAALIAPDSADIWGLLALAYMMQAKYAPAETRGDLVTRGTAAAQRALTLDPNQADALAASVKALPEYRNWERYEQAARAGLRRAPDGVFLKFVLSDLLTQVGRGREALQVMEGAARYFDQSPPFQTYHSSQLWDIGQLDEAERVITRATDLWPRYVGLWFTRVYYLMYNGRPGEAAAVVEDVATRPLGVADYQFDNVAAQANAIASKDPWTIRKAVGETADLAPRGTGFAENAAVFAGYVGDFDTAFRMLDGLYFDRGFAVSDAYFGKEEGVYMVRERHTYNLFRPQLRALRRDPRFAKLTAEIGLDDYWRRTNSRALVIV
jgi:DNA-binding winged helix-turn-helix (wHTH) protein